MAPKLAPHMPQSFSSKKIWKAMKTSTFSWNAVFAEFVSMTMFTFIGCMTALSFSSNRVNEYALSAGSFSRPVIEGLRNDLQINGSFVITTALAFGTAIMVLVYCISHISGGHLNPAVTFSLFLSGHCGWAQALGNMVAQFSGAILAGGLLYGTTPNASESSLGANSLSDGVSDGNAVLGEIIMSCVLCFTVHMCAVDHKNKLNVGSLAPLAIGFAVFLGHCVLIPLDGCSINPARSLGPAVVSGDWADGKFWIFVVGPFVGAIFAVPIYFLLASILEDDVAAEIGVDRTNVEENGEHKTDYNATSMA